MDPKPIEELVAAVLKELDRLNYSKGTRKQYKWFYNTVIRFSKSEGELFYSEELGNKFLRSHYNFSLNGCKKTYFQNSQASGTCYPCTR